MSDDLDKETQELKSKIDYIAKEVGIDFNPKTKRPRYCSECRWYNGKDCINPKNVSVKVEATPIGERKNKSFRQSPVEKNHDCNCNDFRGRGKL